MFSCDIKFVRIIVLTTEKFTLLSGEILHILDFHLRLAERDYSCAGSNAFQLASILVVHCSVLHESSAEP